MSFTSWEVETIILLLKLLSAFSKCMSNTPLFLKFDSDVICYYIEHSRGGGLTLPGYPIKKFTLPNLY